MRRRRRNPEPITIALVAAAALGVGFFLLKKPKPGVANGVITSTTGTPFLQKPDPQFGTGRPANFFDDLGPGNCIAIVQGAAGFHIDGGNIPDGEIVAMRSVSGPSNGVLMVESIDPRSPQNGRPPFAVTPAMSAGAGECF